MARPVFLAVASAAALLAASGGGGPAAAAAGLATGTVSAAVTKTVAAPTPGAVVAARRRTTIKAVSSELGRILTDGRGQAVYVFDKETTSKPGCYGACAKAWPPVLSEGRPVAGRGTRARLLGTTRRRDGKRQVTVNGKPLYFYVHDSPGRVLCHDVREFGGLWLVVRPDGTPPRKQVRLGSALE
jgi:predicted lipoprotein with Yx(FWY)xxD motif